MKWSWRDSLASDDDRKKMSLALKASASYDDDEDELKSLEDLEDDEEFALLSKK